MYRTLKVYQVIMLIFRTKKIKNKVTESVIYQ